MPPQLWAPQPRWGSAGAVHVAARGGGPGDAAAVPGLLRHDEAALVQHGAGVPGAAAVARPPRSRQCFGPQSDAGQRCGRVRACRRAPLRQRPRLPGGVSRSGRARGERDVRPVPAPGARRAVRPPARTLTLTPDRRRPARRRCGWRRFGGRCSRGRPNPNPNPRQPARRAAQVRLASVRRSLFTGEAERSAFLNRLVAGTRDVLRGNRGLAEHGNYHEFCRLLGRLKTNYQLSELVRAPSRMPARSQRARRRSRLACVAVRAVLGLRMPAVLERCTAAEAWCRGTAMGLPSLVGVRSPCADPPIAQRVGAVQASWATAGQRHSLSVPA
jgi:hypothetical protein